jgi:hypothetical protein
MPDWYSALKSIDTPVHNLRAKPNTHPLNQYQLAVREGFECEPDNPFVIIRSADVRP